MTQTLGANPIDVYDLRWSWLLSSPNVKIKVHHLIQSLISFQRNIQERDGGRESPRTPESDPSTEAAVVGSAVASPVQELTEEDMKKKSIAIIEEYLNIKDMSVCLREHWAF